MTIRRKDDAYIADNARVLGDAALGPNVNIWYGAVVRADMAKITVGANTNIQDNAVVHCDPGRPNSIGQNVSIAHGAIVHGVDIGDDTMIGMGAIVLGKSTIGKGCVIAAGAVVPPGANVPDGMLVMGVPGKVVRPTNESDDQCMRETVDEYVALAKKLCQSDS